ncbi:hypothetical protein ACFL43_05635 [Thermodesulfobacteriota bacterium]
MQLTDHTSVIFRQHIGKMVVQADLYEIVDAATRQHLGTARGSLMVAFRRKVISFYAAGNDAPALQLKKTSRFGNRHFTVIDQQGQSLGTLQAAQSNNLFILKLIDQLSAAEYELNLHDPEGKVLTPDGRNVAGIVRTAERADQGPKDIDKYKIDLEAPGLSKGRLPELLLAATVLIDQRFAQEKLFQI